MPHLRSLSIPFLADHVHGTNLDPRELALQIVDIVALRPEVELCYMGIANKCFEILENRKGTDSWSAVGDPSHPDTHQHDVDDGVESDDVEEVDEDDEDGVDVEDDMEEETESSDGSDSDDEASEGGWSDDDGGVGGGKGRLRLRLREILFYDDKVAVFKARHGRL